MFQVEIENFVNQLTSRENEEATVLSDWSNWSFAHLNMLLIHSTQCAGCNYYCRSMKLYWDHRRYCPMPHPLLTCSQCGSVYGLFRYHVICCSNNMCEIPRCLDIRTTRKISHEEAMFLQNQTRRMD